MNEQLEKLKLALSAAGCGREAIEKAEKLLAAGQTEALLLHLRLCRCDLMEQLHESQKRVDCMDYLIRQTRKELSVKT